jgi:hypothetical protein
MPYSLSPSLMTKGDNRRLNKLESRRNVLSLSSEQRRKAIDQSDQIGLPADAYFPIDVLSMRLDGRERNEQALA